MKRTSACSRAVAPGTAHVCRGVRSRSEGERVQRADRRQHPPRRAGGRPTLAADHGQQSVAHGQELLGLGVAPHDAQQGQGDGAVAG